jgi:hypothetical protein
MESVLNITEMLENEVKSWESIGGNPVMQRYVLGEGRAFEKVIQGPRGEPKMCFKNAADFVTKNSERRYNYVEGYMLISPELPILIHHAWVYDKRKKVAIEVTTDAPRAAYYGVEYTKLQLWKWLAKLRYYGIHADEITINVELMKKYFGEKR